MSSLFTFTAYVLLCFDIMSAHQLAGPVNDFSVSLFSKLLADKSQPNVFASPFSISTALSAALLGARNGTADELTAALRFSQLDSAAAVHQLYAQLIHDINKNGSTLSLANYFLIQKESAANPVLDKYKSDLESLYDARIDDVDFSVDGARIQSEVNSWVCNTTHGLIKSILTSPPAPDTPALLLNSIYFNGKWVRRFSNTRNEQSKFYNNGINETETTFMTMNRKSFGYKEVVLGGETVQALELKYKQDSMSMFILLPKNRDGLSKIIAADSLEADLRTAIASLNETEDMLVNLRIPKFTIEADYSLKEHLKAMGVLAMFSSGADFSGVNGRNDLQVADIKHKAFVKVDEEGTEAAAVTLVEFVTKSGYFSTVPPIEFIADHPFIFIIKNMETNIVQFIGTLVQV